MRLLADENIPGSAVASLRDAGNDVAWVRVDGPGSSDREVLARANRERRILLTQDKDFGELAARSGLPTSCGIVLFRLGVLPPMEAGRLVARVLAARDDWAGHFSVIEPGRVRMRPLPEP